MSLSKIFKFVGDILLNRSPEYFDNTSDYTSVQKNDFPIKYSNFPVYNGKMLKKPHETTGPNYNRLTILYSGRPSAEFESVLQNAGYIKATNVRYDKDNTYVIFERIGLNTTKVAYHIKN